MFQDEIGHVVERKREFKPVLRKPAPGEKCTRVIDQDVGYAAPGQRFEPSRVSSRGV
jgi:hypothetical protein